MRDIDKELSDRLDTLESRVMFQDDTIETLNQTVMTQWREIEMLRRQIAALVERLEESAAHADAPANEPPPHY